LGSDGLDLGSDGDASPLPIQRTVAMRRFHSVQTLVTNREVRQTLRGCNGWRLRAMRGHACRQIQPGVCGDQNVSSHPRPHSQGQTTLPAPCRSLRRWAGRGHTPTVVPRLGICSWSEPARSERDPQLPAHALRGSACRMRHALRRRIYQKRHAAHAARLVRPPRAAREARLGRVTCEFAGVASF